MPLAPTDLLAARLARLRAALAEGGLDALLVTALPNVFYLSNFRGTAGALVVTPDAVFLVTDFRYRTAAEALLASATVAPDTRLVVVERSYDETIVELLAGLPARRVGFEAAHLSVKRHTWFARLLAERRLEVALVATDRLVERGRLRKDAHELQILRAAGRLAAALLPDILAAVRPGRREREVAAEIDARLREAGFERPAFDTIVASGPHSALPHHRPGDRPLAPGDLVLLDFGGVYDGYCVDLTRTVPLGEADANARALLEAVREAQAAALAAVRPGVRPSEVDAAARQCLEARGLAGWFGHSTGHGLGIEVHEEPRLARRDQLVGPGAPEDADAPLEAGMVFTLEPGVYRPGLGGVRLEDDVVVTAEGCEILTVAR